MTIFIYKCFSVILMVKLILCQDSPCHGMVQTFKENSNYFAKITVPVPANHNNRIRLNVQLHIIGNEVFSDQYWKKKLQFFGSSDDALKSVQYNLPLVYKLEYPSSNNIEQPKITGLTINNQVLCAERPSTGTGSYQISKVTLSFAFTVSTSGNDNTNPHLNGKNNNNQMKTTVPPNIFYTNPPLAANQFNPKNTNIQNYYSNNQQTSQSALPVYPNFQNNHKSWTSTGNTAKSRTQNNLDICGQTNTAAMHLIANGKDAKMGNHPWIGALFLREVKVANAKFVCGASLISKNVALTAGHCVVNYLNSELYVIFGRIGVNDWLDDNGKKVKVAKVELHPDYKADTADGDIAVLRFANEIVYTPTVKPVCLWNANRLSQSIVNQTGVVAGWGENENYQYSENLQELYLRVVSEEECLRSSDEYKPITSDNTFCAGNNENSGPCKGDSGSGFYFLVNQRWTIRGIVSRSLLNLSGRCDISKYAVYLDVAKYIQWIHQFL